MFVKWIIIGGKEKMAGNYLIGGTDARGFFSALSARNGSFNVLSLACEFDIQAALYFI